MPKFKNTNKVIGLDEAVPALFIGGFPTLTPIPLQTLPEFVICDIDHRHSKAASPPP